MAGLPAEESSREELTRGEVLQLLQRAENLGITLSPVRRGDILPAGIMMKMVIDPNIKEEEFAIVASIFQEFQAASPLLPQPRSLALVGPVSLRNRYEDLEFAIGKGFLEITRMLDIIWDELEALNNPVDGEEIGTPLTPDLAAKMIILFRHIEEKFTNDYIRHLYRRFRLANAEKSDGEIDSEIENLIEEFELDTMKIAFHRFVAIKDDFLEKVLSAEEAAVIRSRPLVAGEEKESHTAAAAGAQTSAPSSDAMIVDLCYHDRLVGSRAGINVFAGCLLEAYGAFIHNLMRTPGGQLHGEFEKNVQDESSLFLSRLPSVCRALPANITHITLDTTGLPSEYAMQLPAVIRDNFPRTVKHCYISNFSLSNINLIMAFPPTVAVVLPQIPNRDRTPQIIVQFMQNLAQALREERLPEGQKRRIDLTALHLEELDGATKQTVVEILRSVKDFAILSMGERFIHDPEAVARQVGEFYFQPGLSNIIAGFVAPRARQDDTDSSSDEEDEEEAAEVADEEVAGFIASDANSGASDDDDPGPAAGRPLSGLGSPHAFYGASARAVANTYAAARARSDDEEDKEEQKASGPPPQLGRSGSDSSE